MKKILIIDDDKDTRKSLCIYLQSIGFSVDVSAGGPEIANLIKKNRWDLLVTDIFMPDVDGIEVIMEAKKVDPNIKILAISGGYRGIHLLEDARELGADIILRKPFSLQEFNKAVSNLLE